MKCRQVNYKIIVGNLLLTLLHIQELANARNIVLYSVW